MKKKTNYSAPQLEQVKMEAEMPVICASGGGASDFEEITQTAGIW